MNDTAALADILMRLAQDRGRLADLMGRAAQGSGAFHDEAVFAHRAGLIRRYL